MRHHLAGVAPHQASRFAQNQPLELCFLQPHEREECDMTTIKNIAENLAIRKNCVTLYCQEVIDRSQDIQNYAIRRVPVLLIFGSVTSWQKKGARLSFSYIPTNLFNTQCQEVKQVVRPRSIVRVPRLHVSTRVPSRPIGLYSHPTKSNTRTSCERRHPRTLSGGSSCCSRLCIPPTPPSWATSNALKPIESWHI